MNVKSQLKNAASLICFVLIGHFQFLAAQDPANWQPTSGPPGGTVLTFATMSDNVVLAGTNRGVFLSQDNGVTWIARSEGYITDEVRTIVIGPTGTIIAGTNEGLYRSTDSGASWVRLDTGLALPSFTASTSGGSSLFVAGPMGVLRSIDDGETWQQINEGLRNTRVSSLEYTQQGDVLAGTEEGLFQWIELPNDWREASNGLNKTSDRIIYTIKQYDDRRLLAGTASGMFIADADFIEWSPLIGLLDSNREAHVIDLAINQSGIIYAATPEIVYRSEDEGINWEPLSRGLPPISADIQSLNTLHLNSNEELLTGTVYYGVHKYAAAIKQWETSTQGLSTLSVTSMVLNAFGDVLAGTYSGLFTSSDQGATWNQTITLENLEGFELIHQDFQGRIFANGSSVMFSQDEGVNWTSIRPERVHALIVLEDNTFLTQPENSADILRSASDGEAWTTVGTFPFQADNDFIYGFIEDAQGRVLAGTEEGAFRSSNQGASWDNLSIANEATGSVRSLAKDASGRVYLATDQGLYRSDEQGDVFELILDVESGIKEIRVVDEDNLLVITADEALVRSIDGGVTWTALNEGLPEGAILLSVLVDDRTIVDDIGAYISIQGAGIFRRSGVIQLSTNLEGPLSDLEITPFPNPFAHSLSISIDLKYHDHLRIEIFDVLGRRVQVLHNAPVQLGHHEINWDTTSLPAGAYFIRLVQKDQQVIRPVIKAR